MGFLWVYYMACTIFFRFVTPSILAGRMGPSAGRMGPVQNAGERSVLYTNVEPDFLSCPFQTGKYYIYIIDMYVYIYIHIDLL